MKRLNFILLITLSLSNALSAQEPPKEQTPPPSTTTSETSAENKPIISIEDAAKNTKPKILTDEESRVVREVSRREKNSVIIEEVPPTTVFQGLSRQIPFRYMIPPYGLEITVEKTTHIIFPSPVVYVDLGSEEILASTSEVATNVLRVKSATDLSEYEWESNLSVITEDGSFYTFNVKYRTEPDKLSIEMHNFLSDGDSYNRPNNALDIYLKELNNENPRIIPLIMQAIRDNNIRFIKHLGSRAFGIQYLLKGVYSYGGMLYFLTEIQNTTNVDFHLDYLTITLSDKQILKRRAVQETVLNPVRANNYVTIVKAKSTELTVLAFPIFTIPNEKVLRFDLHEKNGGRHQTFDMENGDLIRAREIKNINLNLSY